MGAFMTVIVTGWRVGYTATHPIPQRGAPIHRRPLPATVTATAPSPYPTAASSDDGLGWRLAPHWPDVAVAVTEQAIDTAEHLLRGLTLLQQRGRLSDAEVRILALPALRLRQCAQQAQQIVRLHSGQVRQSHEKVDLAAVVEAVLADERPALAEQGVSVQCDVQPVEVLIDPTLAYGLVLALLNWGLQFGTRLHWHVGHAADGDAAGTAVALTLQIRGGSAPDPTAVHANGLPWLLAQQLASTDGGITLQRGWEGDAVHLRARLRRLPPAAPPPPAD